MNYPRMATQAEMVRLMKAVKRANKCESVSGEIVNGAFRAIPVIPTANQQGNFSIANEEIIL